MEIVYRANDGTEFTSKEACYEYEHKLAIFFEECKDILAYDDSGTRINFNKCDPESLEYTLENISYIQFGTQNSIKAFLEKANNDFGLLDIERYIGRPVEVDERYFYDYSKDAWVSLRDCYNELDEIAAVFENN